MLYNWRKHREDRGARSRTWNVDPFSTGVGGDRGDPDLELWRADARRHAVARRAIAALPADRFATVAELHRSWLASS